MSTEYMTKTINVNDLYALFYWRIIEIQDCLGDFVFDICSLDPKGGPVHHSSSDHYYSPPRGPKEDRNWSPHMDSYELMVGASFDNTALWDLTLSKCLKSWDVLIKCNIVSHAALLIAPWSWKAGELSLQNRRRNRLPHQYACRSGQPPTGRQHTSKTVLCN